MDHETASLLFPQKLLKVFSKTSPTAPVSLMFPSMNENIGLMIVKSKFASLNVSPKNLNKLSLRRARLRRSDDSQILVNEDLFLLTSGYFRNTLRLPNALILW